MPKVSTSCNQQNQETHGCTRNSWARLFISPGPLPITTSFRNMHKVRHNKAAKSCKFLPKAAHVHGRWMNMLVPHPKILPFPWCHRVFVPQFHPRIQKCKPVHWLDPGKRSRSPPQPPCKKTYQWLGAHNDPGWRQRVGQQCST